VGEETPNASSSALADLSGDGVADAIIRGFDTIRVVP